MAYNNKNTLLKICKVQDIVLEHKKHGVSQRYVYEHYIRDTYFISYSTFNRWLSLPAKQALRQLAGRKTPSASGDHSEE